ncbi:TRAM domain-containing protein [Haloarchaeobius sp. TZWWS8]|uniref:TRAM domain-containing protein n=1 Tax=Haloarchaeobius sp. TZWWS8 TaxID=3446121 RepID=UPI003EC10710
MAERDSATVEIGDEIVLEIEDLGDGGDGIGRQKGFVVMVPGTKPGQRVRAEVQRVEDDFAVAEKLDADP